MTPIQEAPEEMPVSAILRELCEDSSASVTIGEMVARFGRRAYGAILFIFSSPNLLPLPPGSSTVFGAPLVLIAPQVAIGLAAPWIPRRLAERPIARSTLKVAFTRLLPVLERIERVSRPRLGVFFGPVADRVIGLICTLLALVLILPIPFGNMLPASAIAALSLSMIQKDGVIALIGYGLTAISVLVLILTGNLVVAAVHELLAFLAI